MSGALQEVALYNYDLSATQVQNHFNAGTPGPATYTDWSTFGDNLQRTNDNPNETTITSANAGSIRLDWAADLGSAITDQPVLATGVPINGTSQNVLYIGTEGGMFYALNPDTGKKIWSQNLGSFTSNCRDLPGGISGITGTATFDKSTNHIYVADGNLAVHALDMATGLEIAGWPVNIGLTKSQNHVYGALSFNPNNGLLYVETASFCDYGPWKGSITAINTSNATIAAQFFPGAPYQGAGIWGTGSAAIDPLTNDVYIATGNTLSGPSESSAYGENVVQLDANLNVLAANYPGLQGRDVDFGATPMVLTPGACHQEVSVKNKSAPS